MSYDGLKFKERIKTWNLKIWKIELLLITIAFTTKIISFQIFTDDVQFWNSRFSLYKIYTPGFYRQQEN